MSPAPERPLSVLMITSEWPRDAGHTSHFIARQARFLSGAGVHVELFPFRGGKSPLNYTMGWLRLHWHLMRTRCDLIHAQFGQSALLAFPTRLPIVVTFRGDDLLGIVGEGGRRTRAGRVLQRLSRLIARKADAVIVVSRHMTHYLPTGQHAHVVPSGIDLQLFRPIPRAEARAWLGLPADERLVLFVGDPTDPRKRGDLAQRAMQLLPAGVAARLVVAWRIPHEEVPYYMGACDALLFTSMQEGSPNAVKEALACNLPVVSVPVGDVAERLHGVAGCEVCADDRPETIAAALARVLARGGRCAGREAVAGLDEHRLTEQVIAIYRAALNGGGRPSRSTPESFTTAAPPAA